MRSLVCLDAESSLAVRAKALCNSKIFPPCMIIQIVGFFS